MPSGSSDVFSAYTDRDNEHAKEHPGAAFQNVTVAFGRGGVLTFSECRCMAPYKC